MKLVHLLLLGLLIAGVLCSSKGKLRSRKAKLRHQGGPTAFQDIHRNLYPNQWEENPKEKPNRIEIVSLYSLIKRDRFTYSFPLKKKIRINVNIRGEIINIFFFLRKIFFFQIGEI